MGTPASLASATPDAASGAVSGSSADATLPSTTGFHPRRRSAFDTTHTELHDIAAAAIMGLKVTPANESAPAATGMQITF